MGYIGAITSLKGSNSLPQYRNEDFEAYIDNPKASQARAELFGQECLTVGIQDTFMPTEKGDFQSEDNGNLDKTQYNIRERFGYLQDNLEDY